MLVVHDGEHRTNSMVVVQHSSRGSFARVNTKGLDSGVCSWSTTENIGPTQWWSFSTVPEEGLVVAGEVLPGSTQKVSIVVCLWSTTENIGPTRWWSFNPVTGEGLVVAREVLPGAQFPGEKLRPINLIWSEIHNYRLFCNNRENVPTCSPVTRSLKNGSLSDELYHQQS
ncbi:hypothetical protein TIFTF001_010866 [Ficus carica]|uniref:Uncharacterized protein n=1 Tax=Ficus carica TaxID=3494 RepID=A0AA88D3R1_FICCA|nr:hypothetical protein TIFTF001_010866 [Ficus carica]